jgi:putative signal transducing protein
MAKWVHLTMAPNSTVAEMWIDILREEGLQAMIRPSDAVSFMGVTAVECRVLVVEEDLKRAREVLGDDADT